jgi:omega-6 fatty acid desaturase (delta-12 desaturase)
MTAAKIPSELSTKPLEITDLRLRDILKTLPREVFQQDRRKAWSQVAISIVTLAIGYAAIAIAPWYLLPIAWIFTGTAITGWFVIGHDCGHRSFAKRKWVNDLVGHIAFLPLIYPFHSWRILHNHHHKHTNNLEVDNTWNPFKTEVYEDLPLLFKWGYQATRGRLWWLASILHWAFMHFSWWDFEGKQREQVRFSALVVFFGAAIAFPTLILTTGFWGFVKFWLMPWLGYHFWMSTFTIVHHTDPDIPFTPDKDWHEARAQLEGTVHCEYPAWIEFLCHHINVHIPHHISTAIPSYNLRAAHERIKENWGQYCKENQFSWALMKRITDRCHLYSEIEYYQSFREYYTRIKLERSS